ncbi:MAG: GNAT family N-acetyltransferase [Albidovulum sp.]|uniref:GNAT family N-acetyltransferase n=1 Tax=Albidovulum sp. TaxID=1872424 RepID=UPI003C8DDE49
MLRPAASVDLDFVQDLLNRPENLDRLAAYDSDALHSALTDPAWRLVIWDEGGEDAGFALLSQVVSGGKAKLEELAIDRPGGGHGSKLMNALFDDLRELGVSGLWLYVVPENYRAISFYRRCGFHPVDGPTKLWRRRSGPPVEPIRMERTL